MSKFLLKKRFDLGFLGEEYKEKDTYLEFNAFTIKDIREQLPSLTRMDETNPEEVEEGMGTMLKILKSKYIGGKAIGNDGKLVTVKKEDLDELPVEVVVKAVTFLSQGVQEN